ncbi:MAG: hypothetical protein K0R57_1450 [Paenibacillaceae bacterium]|nr:hypothetical protein [Paenibacillaceae bacterium]
MLYLSDRDIHAAGAEWNSLVDAMESAVRIMDSGDYAQPVKPYLRYKNPANRIIAMPAYMGGTVNAAGLKWIASFPDNIRSGLPRAHSVTVLNDPDTGRPSAVLNSPLPSVLRTASVSGLMIRSFLRERPEASIRLGIIGWGPIGRCHYEMAAALYGDRIERILVHDIRGVDLSKTPSSYREKTRVAGTWQEVYGQSNVFITCTVSKERYINLSPAPGMLLLHVSLRDYLPEALAGIRTIIVDDWEEVCRENTDIELLHLKVGLMRNGTRSLADAVIRRCLAEAAPEQPVLFCPMGMAAFDIATAVYCVNRARELGFGMELE